MEIDLRTNGRVTDHLVKYAHHIDGEAHFSQDGKVLTKIRRKAEPLISQRGHIFTIQIQRPECFPEYRPKLPQILTIEIPDTSRAIKITGWRFDLTQIVAASSYHPAGMPVMIETSPGERKIGEFVAPPLGTKFDDILLFMAAEEMPHFTTDFSAQLLFLGGFDSDKVALDHTRDADFLAFAYPCSNIKELTKQIGTIDL